VHHFPDDPYDADFPSDPVFEEVVGSSTGSEYLAEIVTMAKTVGAPSVTLASLQPSAKPAGGGGASWAPGLSSYAWGINGQVVNDTAGHPFGIRIVVTSWFSDRIANPGASPPDWEQFAKPHVHALLTFTPSGNAVHLRAGRTVTETAWESDSFLFDVPTQQLLFHVPGLGAPLGIMIATFHPTGQFGFL
jgi:hypothetical protein